MAVCGFLPIVIGCVVCIAGRSYWALYPDSLTLLEVLVPTLIILLGCVKCSFSNTSLNPNPYLSHQSDPNLRRTKIVHILIFLMGALKCGSETYI